MDVDFLIVGGGIQGVTLLHELVAAGARRVLLATREDLGVGETLHGHGYMHHGYMLPAGNEAMAQELAACATWWWQRVEAAGSSYLSQPPVYYGVSANAAAARMKLWRESGIGYQPAGEPPDTLRGASWTGGAVRLFTIRDRAVSMRELLEDLAAPLQDRIVQGELRRIDLDAAGTRVVACRFSGGAARRWAVRPRVVLLATGRFAQPLLRAASTPAGARPLAERCRAFHNIRFVPMLLVRGRDLPPLTGFFESHAVSVCTHPIAGSGESMWIVTYLQDHATDRADFDHARESSAGDGLRQSVDRLCALVPLAHERRRDGLRFSGYLGGKIDHPDGGNARHIDDCGLANLRVVWPGLWSLARSNALDLVREFRACPWEAFDPRAQFDPRDFGLQPGVPVGEERRLTDVQSWQTYDAFARALASRSPAAP